MIKSAAVLAAAAMGIAAVAPAAQAQVLTPNPTTFTLAGNLDLTQSLQVKCRTTLTVSVAAGGTTGSVTAASFAPANSSSWQCGTLVRPSGLPWTVSVGPGSTVTVTGIGATSILGTCSGTLSAPWTNGAPSTVALSGSIPGSPGGCSISGTLSASGGVQIL